MHRVGAIGPAARAISAITASSSPGLMWVMKTSAGCCQLPQLAASSSAGCRWRLTSASSGLVIAESRLDHQLAQRSGWPAAPKAPDSGRYRRCRPSNAFVGGEAPQNPRRARCAPPAAPPCGAGQLVPARRPLRRARKRSTGCLGRLGRRVKSGQITPLKMCAAQASSVARQGRAPDRRPARGAAAARHAVGQQGRSLSTWSRWEWLSRMWSMRAISSSVRSPDAGAGVDEDASRRAGRKWCGSRPRWSRNSRGRGS